MAESDTTAPSKEMVEELLATANEASGAARNTWLGFLGIMAYLLITIASTNHEDLLLNNPVTLPVVNVQLPLFSFYFFAPIIFLLLHLGLFIQHTVTAKKLHALNDALNLMTASDLSWFKVHIRQRLHHYAFAQFISGPYGERTGDSTTISSHKRLIGIILWASLIVLPCLTFWYFQIGFLPYHDQFITNTHRFILLANITLLWVFWPAISFGKASWLQCMKEAPKIRFIVNMGASALLLFISFFVTTIPGEPLDQVFMHSNLTVERGDRRVFKPTAWLFEGNFDPATLGLDSPFARNLIVSNKDLVDDDEKWDLNEFSHDLRARDLRYGQFSKTDLSYADLAHAELKGANFTGARLNKVSMAFTNIEDTIFDKAILNGANLNNSWANFKTSFIEAKLIHAKIQCAYWEGVNLHKANLDRADLKGSLLSGVSWGKSASNRIEGAPNTSFRLADLSPASPAECKGGKRENAPRTEENTIYTDLIGANLHDARMQLAKIVYADLRGADLFGAVLYGTDLSGSDVTGSNFGWVALNLSSRPGNIEFVQGPAEGPGDPSPANIQALVEIVESLIPAGKVQDNEIEKIRSLEFDYKRASAIRGWADHIHQYRSPHEIDPVATRLFQIACSALQGHVEKSLTKRMLGLRSMNYNIPGTFSDEDTSLALSDAYLKKLNSSNCPTPELMDMGPFSKLKSSRFVPSTFKATIDLVE